MLTRLQGSEYEVEAIVNHKKVGNELKYEIKVRFGGWSLKSRRLSFVIQWKGWPSSDNTWEPRENLSSGPIANTLISRPRILLANCVA